MKHKPWVKPGIHMGPKGPSASFKKVPLGTPLIGEPKRKQTKVSTCPFLRLSCVLCSELLLDRIGELTCQEAAWAVIAF